MPRPNGPNWLVVATTPGLIEAEMIAGRLQSLGIPAFVQHEPIATAYAISVGPAGQARVLVPESFFQQANSLLESGPSLLDENTDSDESEFDEFEDVEDDFEDDFDDDFDDEP